VLGQRLIERGQHVGRRREAPLPGLLHRDPLVVEIEGERGGVSLGALERGLTDDGEADPGHSFETLVRGRRERVVLGGRRVERQGAERAHGIDEQPSAAAGRDGRDLFHGVEHSRGGFTLDHDDVRDIRVGGERRVESGRVHRHVLRRLEDDPVAAQVLAHADHASAVRAVDEDRELARGRHERADHGLDDKRAAALERHADVGALTAGKLDEPLPDARVQLDELGVARAPVVEHRLLDGARRRQRPRRQQPGIASRLGHVSLPSSRASLPR
jgi:hypothetical protein